MSEYTKHLNCSLNEKRKPNKKILLLGVRRTKISWHVLLSPLLLLFKTNRRMSVTVEMVLCGLVNSPGPLFLDFHLHFWSHLTWFSLKRPINGLFDFADIPTWWFLNAMTHCVVETEQLCWFWIQQCIQKSRYPPQITSGINAEN